MNSPFINRAKALLPAIRNDNPQTAEAVENILKLLMQLEIPEQSDAGIFDVPEAWSL